MSRKEFYTNDEVAELIDMALKLKITLYAENTIADIETLVNQHLLALMGTPLI